MLLLLILLLLPLYLLPYRVTCVTQHLDSFALLRIVELEHILHLPDVGQGLRQLLKGTLLLLLALLLLFLLPLLLLALLLLPATPPLLNLLYTRRLQKLDIALLWWPRFLALRCNQPGSATMGLR